MAFVRLGSTPRYTCVAADVKTVAGIETGATAYETDTGDMYIFNGAAWVAKVDHVQLTGSKAEQASAQDTQVATTVVNYNRAAGATQMEVYCESGYVRVRTDGVVCTDITGEPLAPGFGAGWAVESISVYYIQESVITVVSR